ncbi:hypothetical protein K470DRAFT_34096 [Piedraia hortae CBS 480.64]|uniref:Uncharacterized protein n=1 Tax=Piedraia hortae CBS 480.64 TaxID=1314780 RepID=A0A6A7C288_9PEZI|nr:hypothetical protein K470DRAFT_34096 [Piedraia hortae CBS 480.64]
MSEAERGRMQQTWIYSRTLLFSDDFRMAGLNRAVVFESSVAASAYAGHLQTKSAIPPTLTAAP